MLNEPSTILRGLGVFSKHDPKPLSNKLSIRRLENRWKSFWSVASRAPDAASSNSPARPATRQVLSRAKSPPGDRRRNMCTRLVPNAEDFGAVFLSYRPASAQNSNVNVTWTSRPCYGIVDHGRDARVTVAGRSCYFLDEHNKSPPRIRQHVNEKLYTLKPGQKMAGFRQAVRSGHGAKR